MTSRFRGFMLPLLLTAIAVGFTAWPQTPVPVQAQPRVQISEARVITRNHRPAGVEAPDEDDLLDQILAAGKVVVATDANNAPWSFINDLGELDGFDVDVAKEVASRLGVDVEFRTPEWEVVTAGNWDAQWDVSIGSMRPTDGRAEVLWFTDPYYYNSGAFVVHRDNTSITTVEELAGKRVGVRYQTPCEAYLMESLDMGDYGGVICYPPPVGIDILSYERAEDALMGLVEGRSDAAMASQITLHRLFDWVFYVKYLGTSAFSEPFVFALDQARGPSNQMVVALNAIIADMHSDCSLSWISLRWIGIDITKPCPAAPPVRPTCNSVFLPLVVRREP